MRVRRPPRIIIATASILVLVLLSSLAVMMNDQPSGLIWLTVLITAAFAFGVIVASSISSRSIYKLRRRISQFVRTGKRDDQVSRVGMSSNLSQLYDAFDDMARVSAADEVRARQSFVDRSVLIREVHHRVNNNLQLVSSILSMHIHEARDAATKETLRAVQDRVTSLATVHTDLYQNSVSGEVSVAPLLHEVADSAEKVALSLGREIKITRDIDDASLKPDQAVPLSLITTEALNGAMRSGKLRSIALSFTTSAMLVLSLRFERDTAVPRDAGDVSSQLIHVLVSQLGGSIQERRDGASYEMLVSFKAKMLG